MRPIMLALVALAFSSPAAAQCELEKLVGSAVSWNDNFGSSLDVSGNQAVIGASNHEHAYVFELQAGEWVETADLEPSDGPFNGAWFGNTVAIAGDKVMVASYGARAIYAFEKSGQTWVETQKIHSPDQGIFDNFGYAMDFDGQTLVVGATTHPLGSGGAGAVYTFTEDETGTWLFEDKLLGFQGSWNNEGFGWPVAVSGDTILAGASGHDPYPSLYVFERSGGVWGAPVMFTNPDGHFFGRLAIDGDRFAVGHTSADFPFTNAGAVYLHERQGGAWVPAGVLSASDAATNASFGYNVSLDGDTLVASAQNDASAGPSGAYVFQHDGNGWVETAYLSPRTEDPFDYFFNVGHDGSWLFLGSTADDAPFSNTGSAIVMSLGEVCEPGTPSCFGVGCPCGNDDPLGGCATSTGAGALLSAAGSISVTNDDLVLTVSGTPPFANGIVFMGPSLLPPFTPTSADGMACTGGGLRFPGILGDASGILQQANLVAESVAGGAPITSGAEQHFQSWFRDNAGGPCGGSSNLSNALSITFGP